MSFLRELANAAKSRRDTYDAPRGKYSGHSAWHENEGVYRAMTGAARMVEEEAIEAVNEIREMVTEETSSETAYALGAASAVIIKKFGMRGMDPGENKDEA